MIEAEFARTLAGRALAQAGDEDAAAEALQRAAAAFAAAGAQPHRDAAEQELRRLGRRVHRRSRPAEGATGLASLTGRELEIAALVVDRRTNQEIADHLFLSTKTVESHLRNMFRKLDVSSRIELARAVEREQDSL